MISTYQNKAITVWTNTALQPLNAAKLGGTWSYWYRCNRCQEVFMTYRWFEDTPVLCRKCTNA